MSTSTPKPRVWRDYDGLHWDEQPDGKVKLRAESPSMNDNLVLSLKQVNERYGPIAEVGRAVSLDAKIRAHLDRREEAAWHIDWPEAFASLRAVLDVHVPLDKRNAVGEARHWQECGPCATFYPCDTVAAIARELGITPDAEAAKDQT